MDTTLFGEGGGEGDGGGAETFRKSLLPLQLAFLVLHMWFYGVYSFLAFCVRAFIFFLRVCGRMFTRTHLPHLALLCIPFLHSHARTHTQALPSPL